MPDHRAKSRPDPIATMSCISCHMRWLLARGRHLAQPGTTPPSSSTFEHSQSLRAQPVQRRNLSAYRPRPGKIGADRVEWLESNQPVKTNVSYLIRRGDGQAASKNRKTPRPKHEQRKRNPG
jgi:hypothetical protein